MQRLQLPFYRTMADLPRDENPTPLPLDNYHPYYLFCLKSQLQALTNIVFEYEFEPFEKDGRMVLFLKWESPIVNEKKNEDSDDSKVSYDVQQRNTKEYDMIKAIVDYIIANSLLYFPIWVPSNPYIPSLKAWEKDIAHHIINKMYPTAKQYNGVVMVSLERYRDSDYLDDSNVMMKELLGVFKQAMEEGWMRLDSSDIEFINRWGLEPIKDIDGIYHVPSRLIDALKYTDMSAAELIYHSYKYPTSSMYLPIRGDNNGNINIDDIVLRFNLDVGSVKRVGKNTISLSPIGRDRVIDLVCDLLEYVPNM